MSRVITLHLLNIRLGERMLFISYHEKVIASSTVRLFLKRFWPSYEPAAWSMNVSMRPLIVIHFSVFNPEYYVCV